MAHCIWTTTLLIMMTIAAVISTTQRDGDRVYVSRKNLGYTLHRISTIRLQTGRIHLLFQYKIPTMYRPRPLEELRCSEFNTSFAAKRSCMHFRGVVISLFRLKNDMVELLGMRWEEINSLLEDLNESQGGRNERSLASWLGLASQEDVTKLQANMITVLKSTQRALESWSRGQSLVTKLINISQ